jgi:hypothetical protein
MLRSNLPSTITHRHGLPSTIMHYLGFHGMEDTQTPRIFEATKRFEASSLLQRLHLLFL